MGSRTRGRSRARSTTDQKPDQDQELVAFKKTSFFLSGCLFQKQAVPLLFSPEQHRRRCPLHPWTFPSRECGVCCQSPKSKSGLDSDEGGPSIPFHPRSSTEATGELIEVVWCAGTASPSQCSKWPNNDRREALGTRLLIIDPTELPRYRTPATSGRWLSPCSRSVDLMACRRPTA